VNGGAGDDSGAEREALQHGLDALALALPAPAPDQLLAFLALLHKWNRAYNLTAVRDPLAMVSRHLLDSLAVAKYLSGERFADVGCGAGLPGIPLAIALPESQFDLLDSNGKKIRFVTQAVTELKLANARAIQTRAERFRPERGYDGVLSRAFASLADMAALCEHLLAPDGVLLALKGAYPADELSALPKHYKVEACHPLRVPGEAGQRHLVVLRRQ
jgi:16S rRNA (guanine527-N7)-methyltransferase